MTFPTKTPGMELQPWILVLQEGATSSLALWQISDLQQNALAMFSDRELAEEYAETQVQTYWEARQFSQNSLLQVLVDCYQRGLRYASLNPSSNSATQIFDLKDVLRAARETIRSTRDR